MYELNANEGMFFFREVWGGGNPLWTLPAWFER